MHGWTEVRLSVLTTINVMTTGFWVIISCALVHMYSKFCVFSALFSGYFALNVYFSLEFTTVLKLLF